MWLANHLANMDLIFLFFFLGMLASWVRSDLEIPPAVSSFLSIFLLLSLGLKGGHEVRVSENLDGLGWILFLGLGSCVVIPAVFFLSLRRRLGLPTATGLAAAYGSVSAVTFIAAGSFLQRDGLAASGFMVAVMALMEIPAIVVALEMYRRTGREISGASGGRFSVLTMKSVVLLFGGFVIGILMNDPTWNSVKPVVVDSFKGVLAFFLMDVGLAAQRRLREAWGYRFTALALGIAAPLFFGSVALFLAHLAGIARGDQVILAVLVGSASYIAAPAAIRASVPAANPSLYVALPLALTFPMNVLIGIPYYIELSGYLAF